MIKIALKAMNGTQQENGLVPSRLVFGIIRRFPILSSNLPIPKVRMEALKSAQSEMNSLVVERGVLKARTKSIPPAAVLRYKLVDEAPVFSKVKIEWIGLACLAYFT